MRPTIYLGPNWKSQIGEPLQLTFDGLVNDDPANNVILASDSEAKRWVVIPADRFEQVLENASELKTIWHEQYGAIETPTTDQSRVT